MSSRLARWPRRYVGVALAALPRRRQAEETDDAPPTGVGTRGERLTYVTSIDRQIQNVDDAICGNIAALGGDRGLLSQNLLALIRNFIEAIAVRLHTGDGTREFHFNATKEAVEWLGSGNKRISFLYRFHKQVQISSSHYTVDADNSERLMLKYYEYLVRTKKLLKEACGIDALSNLHLFPVDLDPSLREYHEKIGAKIAARSVRTDSTGPRQRYYIHKTRPFFNYGEIYYEVTFYRAINNSSKSDRMIAFTDIDITDQYAARLTLERDSIDVLGQTMPITIIMEWKVSIRPCELDNFARILGLSSDVRTGSPEYQFVMNGLTAGMGSLLDLIDMSDERYAAARTIGTANVSRPQIFPALDAERRVIRENAPGTNTLRYLLGSLRNRVLKAQYNWETCSRLSGLHLQYGCIPFDSMPFCTSLLNHNPRLWDLLQRLDADEHAHELVARHVKNNVESRGVLYAPVAEFGDVESLNELIGRYNAALYFRHRAKRSLEEVLGHVFIHEYEDTTVSIVEDLQRRARDGVGGYKRAVEQWLQEQPRGIDDDAKIGALGALFSESRVALIYGAAGTGKTTMVNHIANYFNDKRKLFLAHTNPAVDNLKRRVAARESTFRTIYSQIRRTAPEQEYDVLVIDECSTVSNADLLKVLEATSFKLLVLVGDVYQIESIQFGNWFSAIRGFLPKSAVFELTTPYRTRSESLVEFWKKVRTAEDDLAEVIARDGYSRVLGADLFERRSIDEIVLCLNYDGLYGINNVNRFLQGSNGGKGARWGAQEYKVGDPVLFGDTQRFGHVIFNNLKGVIVDVERSGDRMTFDIDLDRTLSEFDIDTDELEWIGDSTVRFHVFDRDTSDDDDDSLDTSVPFQVAYAVSIHKAQGLEYDSVKVVITDANEEDVSHSIFYTAVTRARERLQIFWTPETQQAVLKKLMPRDGAKDIALLMRRRGLKRLSRR